MKCFVSLDFFVCSILKFLFKIVSCSSLGHTLRKGNLQLTLLYQSVDHLRCNCCGLNINLRSHTPPRGHLVDSCRQRQPVTIVLYNIGLALFVCLIHKKVKCSDLCNKRTVVGSEHLCNSPHAHISKYFVHHTLFCISLSAV